MSLPRRALEALPLAVAAALYAVAARAPLPAAGVLVALLGALGSGGRWAVGPVAQRVVMAVAAAAGGTGAVMLATRAEVPGQIGAAWSGVALAALLAATARLFVRAPQWGYRATFGLATMAVLACGETRAHGRYAASVGAFLAASLVALRADEPGWTPGWTPWWTLGWTPGTGLGRRPAAGTAAVVALTVGLAVGLSAALPAAHAAIMRWVLRSYADGGEVTTGFSDQMELYSLDGMAQSDAVVMRVHGRADYLRGAVFDRYGRRRWDSTRAGRRSVRTLGAAPPGGGSAGVVAIELEGSARGFFFLPLRSREVGTASGTMRVDPLGAARPAEGDEGRALWFRPGPRGVAPIAEPGEIDLRVPPHLHDPLAGIAARWTEGAHTPDDTIAALVSHLRTGYRYATHAPRPVHASPVLDFLQVHRQGHCEYFATALALLCRVSGVPARVVAGYRVAEWNALGGYYVVRERDAHAWVEAYTPAGGWQTYDATPLGGLDRPRAAPRWEALVDLVGLRAGAAWAWITRRTAAQLAGAATVASGAWLLSWWLRTRRGRRAGVVEDSAAPERPLACMAHLALALDHHGIRRTPDEALERYAARVAGAALPGELGPTAADLVRRYAALRYGGVGDLGALAAEMDRCAAAVRRAVVVETGADATRR